MLQSDKALRGTEGCIPRAGHRSTNLDVRVEQTDDAVHCASTALFYENSKLHAPASKTGVSSAARVDIA